MPGAVTQRVRKRIFLARHRQQIFDMDRLALQHGLPRDPVARKRPRVANVDTDGHRAKAGDMLHMVAFAQKYLRVDGFANPCRTLGHRIEYWLDVCRRVRDDTQHLADRRLLLQRLLGFVEEANVLDRDYRLVGEGVEQADLRLAEGTYFPAIDDHAADHRCVLKQRHGEEGARAEFLDSGNAQRIALRGGGIGEQVLDVHRPPVPRHAPQTSIGSDAELAISLLRLGRRAAVADHPPYLRPREEQCTKLRLAKIGGLFQDRVEYRLHARRRARDYPQDVRGRRLLLER